MATRHLTKAKAHVFKNDELSQVLHEASFDNSFSKTKSKLTGPMKAFQALFLYQRNIIIYDITGYVLSWLIVTPFDALETHDMPSPRPFPCTHPTY